MDWDALAAALASGELTLGYLESAGRRAPRSESTFHQLSEELGVPFETLERIYVAFGLLRPTAEEHVRQEDLRVLKNIPVLERAGVRPKPARRPEGCAFADLSGYTRLTEELGDEAAARVSLKLAEVVSEIAGRHRGQVVKMLGDGVHFYFEEPHDAVTASLD